jgi:hypothetical protein
MSRYRFNFADTLKCGYRNNLPYFSRYLFTLDVASTGVCASRHQAKQYHDRENGEAVLMDLVYEATGYNVTNRYRCYWNN